jgi:hypothetical protein
MTTRRIAISLLAAIALLMCATVSARAQQDNAAEPECLKGTVAKVTETTLMLKGTTFPNETVVKRDVTFLLDKDTAFFDGAKKVSRSALEPGNIVLVFCKAAGKDGKDRKAKTVRIIGGKKL